MITTHIVSNSTVSSNVSQKTNEELTKEIEYLNDRIKIIEQLDDIKKRVDELEKKWVQTEPSWKPHPGFIYYWLSADQQTIPITMRYI